MDKEQLKKVVEYIDDNKEKIKFNHTIFEITEGNLGKYVLEELYKQLSGKSAKIASQRMAPINVWNKVIYKLSKIYNRPLTRTTENEADQDIINTYVQDGIDQKFNHANENYNSYKWSGLEIYENLDKKKLEFRSPPSDSFIVKSTDPVNPLNVTIYIKFMGTHKLPDGTEKRKFHLFTDEHFISFYEDGTIDQQDMVFNEGVNIFGVIPFEYVSLSKNLLVPMPDLDTLQMTKLFPVLFTDINYGSMFLSFPLIYTIDCEEGEMPASPNLVYDLRSAEPDNKGSIGVVRAEPNLEMQMKHVTDTLAIWLDSRDVRPGAIGDIKGDNFASGISKMIAEADTHENQKRQEIKFAEFEKNFWRRLAKIHNLLAEAGRINDRRMFVDPESLVVNVEYAQEKIIENREDKVRRLKLEKDSGFMSTKRAMSILNPKMEPDEIQEEMDQIALENTQVIEVNDNDDTE